ncbi:MAG: hypothetical protein KC613_08125 [Myxococcales bacterium]|nr:hypothetical protein [Myxococcales bacterium]
MRRALILALATAVAAPALAAPAKVKPVPVNLKLDAVDRGTAGDLARDLAGAGLRKTDLRKPSHGKLFLHLAATSAEPAVVAGALEGMSQLYVRADARGRRAKDHPKVDANYTKVVIARLADGSPQVQAAALTASQMLLADKNPDQKVIDAIVAAAKTGPDAIKVSAIQRFFNVKAVQRPKAMPGPHKERLIGVVLDVAEAGSAPVQASALDLVARVGYSDLPHKARAVKLAQTHAAGADAGLKGVAIRALAALGTPAELDTWGKTFTAALTDASPFVRASAAIAMGRAEWAPAAHGLVKLLDDGADSAHTIGGFTGADGKPGAFDPTIGVPNRVDEAAIAALGAISRAVKAPVTYQAPAKPTPDTVRQVKINTLKAWYAAQQAKLPKAP